MATNKNNTKKSNKKTVKTMPSMVIDLTNAYEAYDVYCAFINAKADKYFSELEKDIIVDYILTSNPLNVVFCTENTEHTEVKKPNVFKRIWNWFTRKK